MNGCIGSYADRAARMPVLTVSLDAIAANVRAIHAYAGRPIMAVVKADAFGHGMAPVTRTAVAAGASWLGVTSVEEALAVRAIDAVTPCLSWLNPVDADFAAAIQHGIDLAVPSRLHLIAIARAAAAVGTAARVHLHVDAGLARDGASADAWPELVGTARAGELAGLIRVVGVMGHLPCADDPRDPSNASGRRAFNDAVAVAREFGLAPRVLHLAATAAALLDPWAAHDLVRIGAGLVGIGPASALPLTPALRWTAPVVTTRFVAEGTGVGYGLTHRVATATNLALLPVGYADGVPRSLGAGAAVQLDGRRCPIVGRVSMDQIVFDTGPRAASLGAVATLFGPGTDGEPTTRDWAGWANTLEHDIVTGIGPRVHRATVDATTNAAATAVAA